ncbi:TPA: hypothetical protein ACIAHU_003001 [Yersinia enterocolitica]
MESEMFKQLMQMTYNDSDEQVLKSIDALADFWCHEKAVEERLIELTINSSIQIKQAAVLALAKIALAQNK